MEYWVLEDEGKEKGVIIEFNWGVNNLRSIKEVRIFLKHLMLADKIAIIECIFKHLCYAHPRVVDDWGLG